MGVPDRAGNSFVLLSARSFRGPVERPADGTAAPPPRPPGGVFRYTPRSRRPAFTDRQKAVRRVGEVEQPATPGPVILNLACDEQGDEVERRMQARF